MRRMWIVLAALGMLILCVVAGILIARRFMPPPPSSNLAVLSATPLAGHDGISPTPSLGTEGKAALPEGPPQSDEQLSMETLMKGLLGGAPVRETGDLVTKPEKCVFLGFPYRLAFLEEENRLLMFNSGGVYAFDVASGEEVWHRYLESTRGWRGATFGQRQVLGWSDQGVFLLDAATGRETWCRDDDTCGPIQEASLSPDETQVLADCERSCILYAVADRTQRILPKPANAWFNGWLPGNKTLIFVEQKGRESIKKWLFMNADNGAVSPGWEPAISLDQMTPILSAQGELSVAINDGEADTVLRFLDARTGKLLREFKGIPGRTNYFLWLRDARRLFSVTKDGKQARMIDAETGAIQFSLSREGHVFRVQKPFEDASGNAWFFSQDKANNRYVWPLTPDATPRRVLDGDRIAPGQLSFYVSNQCYLICDSMVDNQLWTHTAYTLKDMRKAAEWRARAEEPSWSESLMNTALTHYVRTYRIGKDDQYWLHNMAFSVYIQGKETPVCTGKGRPMAVSPDAKYLAVQTGDTTSGLYDVAANRIVSDISVPPRETNVDSIVGRLWAPGPRNNYIYMNAAFSDDGTRVAFNSTQAIEVIDLTEGYPRRAMAFGEGNRVGWGRPCLSPDGSRVLCGGGSRALLFDADTGALLHIFEETARFVDPYGQGFWNGLFESARDLAGKVTDTFKSGAYVEAAFAEGGARVITHAAGQIIRVWDTASGTLLETIRTGLPEKRNKDGNIRNRIVLSPTGRFAFCHNQDNFGIASLWSLADGTLERRYQLTGSQNGWPQAMPADDGTDVYIDDNGNLYRWPGAPAREK